MKMLWKIMLCCFLAGTCSQAQRKVDRVKVAPAPDPNYPGTRFQLSGPYDMSEALQLMTDFGAKWTGKHFVPYLIGDDPREFSLIQLGTPLMVWVPFDSVRSVCKITPEQAAELPEMMKVWGGDILVHGELHSLSMLRLDPCLVDVIIDRHGDVIYRSGDEKPQRGLGIVTRKPSPTAGMTPCEPLSTPDPEYTEEARKAHVSGVDKFRVTVGTDGLVHDIETLNHLGMGLDEQALATLSKWCLKPAMRDGKPVPVTVNVEFNFGSY